MLKNYFFSTIKLLFIVSIMLFVFVGCGGSDGTKPKQSESTQVQDTEALIIKVSPHILKISYLPRISQEGDETYSIDNSSTEGNVTLLDENAGRYSYLSAENMSEGEDTFSFKVMQNTTVLVSREVKIHINKIDIKINDVIQNNFSSNLPIVIVDTGDKEIPDDPKIKGSMTIIEPEDKSRSHLELQPSYSGYMEIEIRGFSSQRFPKKQYSVDTETWDEEDDDISLLYMPKEHKWILHAPYSDKSLMRNYLAYHKTRDSNNSKYYAVRSTFVELLTRTKDHYRYDGVYILMEKIKRDKNRVHIEKLKDEDVLEPEISGGYILQQDRVKDGDETITGVTGQQYVMEYPEPNSEQLNYIEDHVWKFERALHTNDYNNTLSDNYYNKWINEDSFIMHILAREFFRDYDNWITSEYFHKDRISPISMGPIWDFNLGMGNCSLGYGGRTDGWSYTDKVSGLGYWSDRLMHDPTFRNNAAAKWRTLRSTVWSDSNLINFIDNTKALLSESAARNFERWPVLGKKVFLEREACTKDGVPIYCDTFESAVNEHLKIWLLSRAKWIDAQFK